MRKRGLGKKEHSGFIEKPLESDQRWLDEPPPDPHADDVDEDETEEPAEPEEETNGPG